MQLPVGVLKHVISSHMNSHVLLPQAFIQSLQFLAEVPVEMAGKNMSVIYKTSNCSINSKNQNFIVSPLLPLNVKVQDAYVVNQHSKRAISQVSGGLAQDLVKHCAVSF